MCATLIILQLTEENVVRVLVNGGRDRFAHGAGSRNRSISTKNQGESEKEKRRKKNCLVNKKCTCLVIGSGWMYSRLIQHSGWWNQTTKNIYIGQVCLYERNESWNHVIFVSFFVSRSGWISDGSDVRIRMNRASTRGNNGKEEKETRKRPADITNGGGVIFFFSDVLPAGGWRRL